MGDKTQQNLKDAFAGESQANRRYLAFAAQADKEGFAQAAKLFRAAAESETVHALAHLTATGSVASTADNLKTAIGGETYEFKTMYPPMVQAAEEEDDKVAKMSFWRANQVEQEHANMFTEMLNELIDAPFVDYYVCQVCGHVHLNGAPDKCPICGASKDRFKMID